MKTNAYSVPLKPGVTVQAKAYAAPWNSGIAMRWWPVTSAVILTSSKYSIWSTIWMFSIEARRVGGIDTFAAMASAGTLASEL